MAEIIRIKKGLTIHLEGEAEKKIIPATFPGTVALQPGDFMGLIPRLLVKEGEEVKAGTPIFSDKNNEAIQCCSPVSGEIIEIRRGDKRKLIAIVILPDQKNQFLEFKIPEIDDRQSIINVLLQSGFWACIRQRPFGSIANPEEQPKSIFVSCFDTNPLAADFSFVMQGQEDDFQTGLNVLGKLTAGKLHLSISEKQKSSGSFSTFTGIVLHTFSGPHPSGNVGTQIHHIDPVNKGEVVWYVNPQDVIMIGRFFRTGHTDTTKILAITGSQIEHPAYVKTISGGAVQPLINACGLKKGNNRIVSGSVLSGVKISPEGYPGFYDSQITVIPETHEPEFMGWLMPGFNKLSISRAFFSWMNPSKKYDLNSQLHGEERPFVMSGEYEKVFPLDIHPVFLLKSILVEDLEMMEQLGIYEVVEEDFALCEFICTSKIQSQEIIRRGLDLVRRELV